MQGDPVQPSSSIKRFENFHFGKTLAYRAVYGGGGSSGGAQRSGSRKAGGNDARAGSARLITLNTVLTVLT
ncbi:unnamed protein product [Lupinus luteus]|uniref:Uncharacterized protein n=1 Tax=Lupinus luteus TaxID=3873 RepID=A0AAV1XIB4_LUPLU